MLSNWGVFFSPINHLFIFLFFLSLLMCELNFMVNVNFTILHKVVFADSSFPFSEKYRASGHVSVTCVHFSFFFWLHSVGRKKKSGTAGKKKWHHLHPRFLFAYVPYGVSLDINSTISLGVLTVKNEHQLFSRAFNFLFYPLVFLVLVVAHWAMSSR